jgi:hypothetical protein
MATWEFSILVFGPPVLAMKSGHSRASRPSGSPESPVGRDVSFFLRAAKTKISPRTVTQDWAIKGLIQIDKTQLSVI